MQVRTWGCKDKNHLIVDICIIKKAAHSSHQSTSDPPYVLVSSVTRLQKVLNIGNPSSLISFDM